MHLSKIQSSGLLTCGLSFLLEKASRSALMKYIINSRIYVSTTNIYWSNKLMFRPTNRSSSGLQQNKSKVLFGNWDPSVSYNCKEI